MCEGALTDELNREILIQTKRYGRFNWDNAKEE